MALDVWKLIKTELKMGRIINIDTSSKKCSVALAIDGEIVMGLESKKEMDHAAILAPFIDECVRYAKNNNFKLDAVSVTDGPGSYTGLRIGLSMAKGLAYSLDIPLVTISSLEVIAVRAIFSYPDISGTEIIVPMIDARRMEVYTTFFNSCLKREMEEKALILDENSFDNLYQFSKVLFIGDGSLKFQGIYQGKNGVWLGNGMPHAKYMVTLAEKKFNNGEFADLAYSVPRYLKEYQITVAKSRL